MENIKRIIPRIVYNQQGRVIGYTLEAGEQVMAGQYLFGAMDKGIECVPTNLPALAHDNQSQQLAMPANPARWLNPV